MSMDKVVQGLAKWSCTSQGRDAMKKAGTAIAGAAVPVLVEAAPVAIPVAVIAAVGYGIYSLVSDE